MLLRKTSAAARATTISANSPMAAHLRMESAFGRDGDAGGESMVTPVSCKSHHTPVRTGKFGRKLIVAVMRGAEKDIFPSEAELPARLPARRTRRREQSQFRLLGKRRYGPFLSVQFLSRLNDNVLKQALVILLAYHTTCPPLFVNIRRPGESALPHPGRNDPRIPKAISRWPDGNDGGPSPRQRMAA